LVAESSWLMGRPAEIAVSASSAMTKTMPAAQARLSQTLSVRPDQPHPACLGCVDLPSGHRQLKRIRKPDGGSQALRTAIHDRHTPLAIGKPEPGILSRDP
jgi:hypothetical protein